MIDTKKFKTKLEEELKLVESELGDIGTEDKSNPVDGWSAVETEIDSDHADENDVADNLESFAENTAIVSKLKVQYENIKAALEKISEGTYGKCEVDGKDIPEARLEANPSAKTCIEHSKKK